MLPGTHRHSTINRKVCREGQAWWLPQAELDSPQDEKMRSVPGKNLGGGVGGSSKERVNPGWQDIRARKSG